MEPTREIFWNIHYAWVMYLLAAIATGILIWSLVRIPRRWHVGGPMKFVSSLGKRWRAFGQVFLTDGIGQLRFLGADRNDLRFRELYAGLAHAFILSGCIIFLLGAFLDFLSHYFFHFLEGNAYLAYSVITDGFGILAIIGIIMIVFRRYVNRPERLDNRRDDLVTLSLIFVVIITGFIIEGLRMAATELVSEPGWAVWSPGGYVFARAFTGASHDSLLAWHVGLWWFHTLLALGAIAYVSIYNTKLYHIIWDPVNVFFRNQGPRGALALIDFEKTEQFGAGKIEDFSWKQLLDLDACTRCGRCQDACPAHSSGKALNPKKVIQDLKNHLYAVYPGIISLKPVETRQEMPGEVISDEVIWDCTTCRNCQQACPVYIEHIDKIIDIRRNLAMEKCRFPEAVQEALKCLSTRGHPYRGTTATRTTWTESLDIPTVEDAKDIDILYWVGCSAALDDRNIKVAQATAKVLKAAGVKFAILGDEESCCGDPARRLGDEYLFQTLCQQNIEILKGHNVTKILTTCPHCFNSLKHEYPQFGGKYEVVHHSQFLLQLINEGRIKINKTLPEKIAYHDSCYLGRYNDIYNEPRAVLKAVSSHNIEFPHRRTDSFCCGGGGGHMWMEEDPDKRVNVRRVAELLTTGATGVATACPYCLTMFDDGIKAKEAEEKVRARDLAELVAEGLAGTDVNE
jgi:Fe-S oxidoreductase/nitrate reductase gamma subunit